MTAEEIARALGGRKVGTGYQAKCPAHADGHPSLSIHDSSGGSILVRCHAGCSQYDVIAALKARGLLGRGGSRSYYPDIAFVGTADTLLGGRRRYAFIRIVRGRETMQAT
jgi:hypothetical protein